MKTRLQLFIAFGLLSFGSLGQCANQSNIYTFVYNGKSYEVVKENKTWVDAATCAVERGGILAEIDDVNENTAIYNELINNAGITNSNTTAPDGGGGAYVWLGGNDISTEGVWIWDGDNNATGSQFWQGTASGNPVGGLYTNWGNEPDNYNNQDALGLSLNGWPLGSASQWNDVDDGNTLYFVIEHSSILGINEMNPHNEKELVKIMDLTGRECDAQNNTVLLYQYNDGSIEKVFITD